MREPGGIDLDGAYTPPFGPAGAALDATIGYRLAEATATELLPSSSAF